MLWLKNALLALLMAALLASAGSALAEEAFGDRHCVSTAVCGQLEAGDADGALVEGHCGQHCQAYFLTSVPAFMPGFGCISNLTSAMALPLAGRSAPPPLVPPIG